MANRADKSGGKKSMSYNPKAKLSTAGFADLRRPGWDPKDGTVLAPRGNTPRKHQGKRPGPGV